MSDQPICDHVPCRPIHAIEIVAIATRCPDDKYRDPLKVTVTPSTFTPASEAQYLPIAVCAVSSGYERTPIQHQEASHPKSYQDQVEFTRCLHS